MKNASRSPSDDGLAADGRDGRPRPTGTRAEPAPTSLPAAAALAHDLRSPLAAVLGFARLAREDLAAGDTARAALLIERIERSAGMLEAVLRSALEPADVAPVADLAGVLAQVRAERKRDLERRGIHLSAPTDAPPLAARPADLYRLVSNLVANAVEHMGDVDGAAIEIAIACRDDVALLRVRDNGVGIAPEDRERVFDVAQTRCASATASPRGLGLAIVRELAASWGGCAWIDANAPVGATICVTIPVAR